MDICWTFYLMQRAIEFKTELTKCTIPNTKFLVLHDTLIQTLSGPSDSSSMNNGLSHLWTRIIFSVTLHGFCKSHTRNRSSITHNGWKPAVSNGKMLPVMVTEEYRKVPACSTEISRLIPPPPLNPLPSLLGSQRSLLAVFVTPSCRQLYQNSSSLSSLTLI